jgi:hypothetical protein
MVELAIVLVVIGLILGMAIKGKTLIDSAKIRAEVIKISKFESAVYTYFVKTGCLPALDKSGRYDTASLVAIGALSQRDFYSEMAGDNWTLVACGMQPSGFNVSGSGAEVCARMGVNEHKKVPARLVCNIEKLLDDENLSTGLGRVQSGATNFSINVYNDCNSAPAGVYDYMYIIF